MPDQWTFVAPDGAAVELTNAAAGLRVTAEGSRGLHSPQWDLTTSKFAGVDGVTTDAIRADAGDVALGLLVQADSDAALLARIRSLVHTTRPKLGEGQLVCRHPDGTTRTLSCRVVGGLPGSEESGSTFPGRWWRAQLQFHADDPWWFGPTESLDFGLAAPTPFFPFFPLVLSPSSVQGQLTVDLTDADAEMYPLWVVTGPGSALSLTNVTTGRAIQVASGIGDGQSVVIDTRTGQQSVRRSDGANLMPAVSSDPALWALADGVVNTISVLLTGANGSSRIAGTFARRYGGI